MLKHHLFHINITYPHFIFIPLYIQKNTSSTVTVLEVSFTHFSQKTLYNNPGTYMTPVISINTPNTNVSILDTNQKLGFRIIKRIPTRPNPRIIPTSPSSFFTFSRITHPASLSIYQFSYRHTIHHHHPIFDSDSLSYVFR